MANVLAKLQQNMLKAQTEEERVLREKIFIENYYRLKKKAENGYFGRMSIKKRLKLHPLILFIYKIKNRLSGLSFEVLRDDRTKTNRPIIFAITHVGKFDIEVVSEAIKDHYFLLSGDYEHIQGTIDEPFLNINGVLYFNEMIKKDRQEVQQRMVDILLSGGNLMYFPEGTWNVTENLPVLPLYWGIVSIAKRGNAIIVPVAAEQYGKHFEICIWKNIDMSQYGNDAREKNRAITELRDILATMKWNIWERHTAKRSEIREDEWDEYCKARFDEWPGFNREYIADLIFRPKELSDTC